METTKKIPVPTLALQGKIHSKQFVYETLTGWGLNPEKTYSFKGEYLEEQKMVAFGMKSEDL